MPRQGDEAVAKQDGGGTDDERYVGARTDGSKEDLEARRKGVVVWMEGVSGAGDVLDVWMQGVGAKGECGGNE